MYQECKNKTMKYGKERLITGDN